MNTSIVPGRQPVSAQLVTSVAAPCVALSGSGAVIDGGGAAGLYDGDLRLISSWELRCVGGRVEPSEHALVDAATASFQSVIRGVGDPEPHATVWTTTTRTAERDGFVDRITITNGGRTAVSPRMELHLGSDLASLAGVRAGETFASIEARASGTRTLVWSGVEGRMAVAVADPEPSRLGDGLVAWDLELEPGASRSFTLHVRSGEPSEDRAVAASGRFPLTVRYGDPDWQRHLDRSISDLDALRLRVDGQEVVAAGAPWYLALFGRDALWTARLCLPFDGALAVSTLRALAAHRGRVHDPATAEEPGKILHERREGWAADRPTTSYASVDATPLWIVLLAEAIDAGVRPDTVVDLLPALTETAGWLADALERDRFLFYDAIPGHGAVHQAWKDSTDSVFDSRGHDLEFPVALCEVQGYAHEALRAAARLFRIFELDGAERLDEAAAALRRRFGEDFWVDHARYGRIPALAVDGTGHAADVLTSNIGHLLGTGLLDAEGERRVVELLMTTDLSSPLGIRTLAASEVRYSPVSYHNGSVWPHDVGIIVRGLAASGFRAEAVEVAGRIVATSRLVDGRLPEVWGGDVLPGTDRPLAYPTACRPQAWSAAAALACLTAVAAPVLDEQTGRWSCDPSDVAGVVSIEPRD